VTTSLSLRVGLVLAISLGLNSCTSRVSTIACHRYEAGYLGPDNQFRLDVPKKKFPILDAAPDRLILALSLLPPPAGLNDEATLVHTIDGREVARWKLQLPPPRGISARCTIASTANDSSCEAHLSDLPTPTGGRYRLYSDHGRLIEAGLSFYVCE